MREVFVMKRAVKWILSIVLVLALVFIGGAYVLPDSAVVQRQIEIAAPPEKVFAAVGDLKRFGEFSPWAELDPKAEYVFEGADAAVGQKMSWTSKDANVGSGSMTITERVDNRRVAYDLNFGGMGAAKASFELAPSGTGTAVTWGFKTELRNPMERWMGLMFDRWIGADYEKGLAKLKAVAEAQ
jgi:carbon monoxide dehydrogenase subunit G